MSRCRAGFTFLELIIAGTMMAILFVGLATHLRGGVTVWREVTRRVEAWQEEQAALDRFTQDLTQAIRYYADSAAYEAHELPPMEFAATSARWYTVDTQNGVRLLSYECADVDGASWWVRMPQSLEALQAPEPATTAAPVKERLLPGCTRFGLRYAYLPPADAPAEELNWQSVWPGAAHPGDPLPLPRLIEVQLDFADGRTLRRTVVVPQGLLKAYTPAAAS